MLNDDAFLRAPPPPPALRQLSAYERAALEGVGDREHQEARDLLWRHAGVEATAAEHLASFHVGDPVYYRVGDVDGEGRIARIEGYEALVETQPGAFAQLPLVMLAHLGRAKNTAATQRTVRQALGSSWVQSTTELTNGDGLVRIGYRIGLRPDESEVRELVASVDPQAAVLDARDEAPGVLAVVIHHPPHAAALALSASVLHRIAALYGPDGMTIREVSTQAAEGHGVISTFVVEQQGRPVFTTPDGRVSPILSAGAARTAGRVVVGPNGQWTATLHSTAGDVDLGPRLSQLAVDSKTPPLSQMRPDEYHRMRERHETGQGAEEAAARERRKRRQQDARGDFEARDLGGPSRSGRPEHIGGPGALVAEFLQVFGPRAAAVQAMLEAARAGRAPDGVRSAQLSLADSFLYSKGKDPAAANAIDRLVVEYLARSPEVIDQVAPGAYKRVLEGAIHYWTKMDPSRLEKVRQRYGEDQEVPTDMTSAPSRWQRFRERLSPYQRALRESATGATDGVPPAAPAAVTAPSSGTTAPSSGTSTPPPPSTAPSAPALKRTRMPGTSAPPTSGLTRQRVPRGVAASMLARFAKPVADPVLDRPAGDTPPSELPSAGKDRTHEDVRAPSRAAVRLWHDNVRRRGRYLACDVHWDVSAAKALTPKQLEGMALSFVRGLPQSVVGLMGGAHVVAIDLTKGVALVQFASSLREKYPREEYAR